MSQKKSTQQMVCPPLNSILNIKVDNSTAWSTNLLSASCLPVTKGRGVTRQFF